MSAGRLTEALAPFVTCGERYCDTFDNGNPNCDDCARLSHLAVQRVLDLLDSDELAAAIATGRVHDPGTRAALAAIRNHLAASTKEDS